MLINSDQVTETGTVATEPVHLEYAKDHLRVDIADEDILVSNLITAAREYVERYCARSFVQHTYRADLVNFADIMVLPHRPIQSITSIKYYDTASPSVLQTLSTDIYTLQNDIILRNYGKDWPSVDVRADAVQITYSAGYSNLASPEDTVANTPASVRAAILLLVADLYENREGQSGSRQLVPNPTGDKLLQSYRVYL